VSLDPTDRWIDRLFAANAGASGLDTHREVLISVASSMAERVGLDPSLMTLLGGRRAGNHEPRPSCPIDLDDELDHPRLLGRLRERLLGPGLRRSTGSHYTPAVVAQGLWELAATPGFVRPPRILDPSCGGGSMLLAGLDGLIDRGVSPEEGAGLVWGRDVDQLAVEVADASIRLWAAARGVQAVPDIAVADGTLDEWEARVDRPKLLLTNPPFGNQLSARTRRSAESRAMLLERFGADAGGYLDTAGVFVLRALTELGPGDRIATLAPGSLASARDAAGMRERLLEAADLRHFWVLGRKAFSASVDVIGIVADVTETRPKSARVGAEVWTGTPRTSVGTVAGALAGTSWSPLLAAAHGVPEVRVRGERTIGDLATATAGFRRHYYGLVEHLIEADDQTDGRWAPLLTSGLIDPFAQHWGRRSSRVARRKWNAVGVDLDGLWAREHTEGVAAWVNERLRPKLVVAAQTRVIEVVADPEGRFIPAVPTVSVEPASSDDLWLLAAALGAPVTSALGCQRTAGSAMDASALKLAARELLELPLPSDTDSWILGASLARRLHHTPSEDLWDEFVEVMAAAYGQMSATPTASGVYSERRGEPGSIDAWWNARRPRRSLGK